MGRIFQDMTPFLDGVSQHFPVRPPRFEANSSQLIYNKQNLKLDVDYTEDETLDGFTLTSIVPNPQNGDTLVFWYTPIESTIIGTGEVL